MLTKPEIRKDMREIQRSLQADSDSECSVKSEDVLNSEYPVKPRKTPAGIKVIMITTALV